MLRGVVAQAPATDRRPKAAEVEGVDLPPNARSITRLRQSGVLQQNGVSGKPLVTGGLTESDPERPRGEIVEGEREHGDCVVGHRCGSLPLIG